MSAPSKAYLSPPETFIKTHSHHQPVPKDMTTTKSFKIDSAKAFPTPPTPYDGDDELSELADSSKSFGQQPYFATDEPQSSTSESSHNTLRFDNMKRYESDDDENVKDESGLSASDSENDAKTLEAVVDPLCAGEADGQCTLGSSDHRKVTSHFFGRNKRCTHQIPEDCWIKYCRKHYQRQKYRRPEDWFETQLLLIDAQLDKLEAWGGVMSWKICIRKGEKEMIDKENEYLAQHGRFPDGPLRRERFLLPSIGENKTFDQVRKVVDVINKECDDTKSLTLPSFEFLPDIDPRRNPRPRRGLSRRPARTPAPRTPAVPSTFRLAADESGQLTKIEMKPRQPSTSGYKAAKAKTLAKKRSSSTFDGDKVAEPASRQHMKKKEAPLPVRKRIPSPSDTESDTKEVIGNESQRPAKRSLAPSPADEKATLGTASLPPRPVKRHRKSYSM
ncbi:MAG: hypothetical protein Q9166_006014 [cf. Caloplaca sp. 2 TL-2023]